MEIVKERGALICDVWKNYCQWNWNWIFQFTEILKFHIEWNISERVSNSEL